MTPEVGQLWRLELADPNKPCLFLIIDIKRDSYGDENRIKGIMLDTGGDLTVYRDDLERWGEML